MCFSFKTLTFIHETLSIIKNETEAIIQTCSEKKGVLKNLIIVFTTCNFIKKETLAQVFSCEFCEIFKNNFCYRTPPVAASDETNKTS